MFLQFGPQHPGSHGLLRFTLELSGETVVASTLYVGLLHRGTEKLMETRQVLASVPYMDRLDYVSTLTSEHAFVIAVEGLSGGRSSPTASYKLRTLFDELTRLKNHLMHVSILTFDIGNFFVFFFFLEWREHLMGFYEAVAGARLHAALYRPFESRFNYLPNSLLVRLGSHLAFFFIFFKKLLSTGFIF